MSRYVDAQMEHLIATCREAIANSESYGRSRQSNEERRSEIATFFELAALAKANPEAQNRWHEIRAAARAELQTGHRAAKANEASLSSGGVATSVILRSVDELVASWNPAKTASNATMIDMLAQAWTAQLFWHERMMLYACIEVDNENIKKEGAGNSTSSPTHRPSIRLLKWWIALTASSCGRFEH